MDHLPRQERILLLYLDIYIYQMNSCSYSAYLPSVVRLFVEGWTDGC